MVLARVDSPLPDFYNTALFHVTRTLVAEQTGQPPSEAVDEKIRETLTWILKLDSDGVHQCLSSVTPLVGAQRIRAMFVRMNEILTQYDA